jgi:outer membrane biosynthesis protein TonB
VPDTHPSIADTQQDVNTLVQGSLDNSLVDMGAVAAIAEVAAKKEPGPPVAVAQSAQATGHRGLYISLGALIVVLVLIAAGIYMPTRKKASAAPVEVAKPEQQVVNPAPQVVQPTPATTSDSTQVTAGAAAVTTAPAAPEKPKPSPTRTKKLLAQNANSPAQSTIAAQNQPPGPSQAELDETEHEIDQLSARAAAVSNSLDNFQRSSGYGLRGDMVAKQASMKINLAKAQDAIGRGDLERAKKFEGLATSDVEALEKFLGR